jgi:ubiquinone/menaquinone biosynthesis C-methylase UbiE
MHVLDVGCGIGVSTFPLLDIIGPKGKIAGVDISLHLISQALKRAEYLQVPNASFSATWQEILDEFNEKLTKDQYLHLTISAHGFVLRKPFM